MPDNFHWLVGDDYGKLPMILAFPCDKLLVS